MLRTKASALCVATLLFLGTGTAFGQCSWSTKVVLTQTTSDQPGLAAYTVSGTNKIVLAYVGTDSNRTLNVMTFTNGTSWGSQTPLKGWQSSYGVALGGANFVGGCAYLIMAWPNRSNNVLYAADSADSYHWSGPVSLQDVISSTPAIDAYLGDIAYRIKSTNLIAKMATGCSLAYVQSTYNFFDEISGCPFPNVCTTTSSGSPAVSIDSVVRAIAMGVNQPIYAQIADGSIFQVGTSSSTYSGYGITGACVGANQYLAWRGGSGNINLWSSSTGTKVCSDTSNSAPTITSFNGALYVAWRSSNNTINIASIPPF
jgi:hypothetical protein